MTSRFLTRLGTRDSRPVLWLGALVLATAAMASMGCTPMSKSFEVQTSDLTCDEANRLVYASVVDMHMKVTAFTQAQPGRPGYLKAVGSDRSGDVSITCDPVTGVHIDPHQTSMGDPIFERGILLSVTGRSGLTMDRGQITGRVRPASAEAAPTAAAAPPPSRKAAKAAKRSKAAQAEAPAPAAAGGAGSEDAGTDAISDRIAPSQLPSATAPSSATQSGGVTVDFEPQLGFETVLDFDADIAAAGVLPIKVTIHNGTSRAYQFAPSDIVVRVKGSGARALPLKAAEAAARLSAKAGDGAQTEIGNVASAKKVILDRELKGGRLAPGAATSGYVYFPVGNYDRARLNMIDVSTGETEGFLVEF